MTKRKAYIHLASSLLLIVLSIILFVLKVTRNYVFWYHIVFYIAAAATVIITSSAIYYMTKKQEHIQSKTLELLDWLSFTTQSLAVILFIFMFFIFSSTVKQSSMYPTLQEGNIVIATQFNYTPERGDIVIVHVDPTEHPTETEKLLVKRIAAVPGDHITFLESPSDGGYKILINDELYQINGQTFIARYISNEKEILMASLDDDGYVKASEYVVFGDNEANSKDSRNLGTFDDDDIIGHVIYKIWPFGGLS